MSEYTKIIIYIKFIYRLDLLLSLDFRRLLRKFLQTFLIEVFSF